MDHFWRNIRPMEPFKILEIKQSVFADNDRQADALRQGVPEQGPFRDLDGLSPRGDARHGSGPPFLGVLRRGGEEGVDVLPRGQGRDVAAGGQDEVGTAPAALQQGQGGGPDGGRGAV